MYVCICKGITESELIEIAESHGTHGDMTRNAMLESASDALGIGTGCGRCLEFAEDLLEQRSNANAGNASCRESRAAL